MILKIFLTFVCLLPISGLLAMSLPPLGQPINTEMNQDLPSNFNDEPYLSVLIDYPPMAENFGNAEPPSRDVPISSNQDDTNFMEDESSGEVSIVLLTASFQFKKCFKF